MESKNDKTLRQIASAYAKGYLDKKAYRETRRRLILGLIEGSVSLKENHFLSPVLPSNALEEAKEWDTTEVRSWSYSEREGPTAELPVVPPPKIRVRTINRASIAIAILALLIAMVALLFFFL